MNAYRAVQLDTGRWAVERLTDGKPNGFAVGACKDEAEACILAYELSRAEMKERD
jgi:hypothetical protein